jgi:hypothetical protein
MEGQSSKVVDIRQFLEARERERLPLFDGDDRPALPSGPRDRVLSERELEHRQRMLRHLAAHCANAR